jgi:hypothetical protein
VDARRESGFAVTALRHGHVREDRPFPDVHYPTTGKKGSTCLTKFAFTK